MRYTVSVDSHCLTRFAHIAGRSPLGAFDVQLKADGAGGWRVGGRRAPQLDGCLDVDLEASACTNALPVRRLGLAAGATAEAPAAYVRATDARVERLEQRYTRLPDDDGRLRFDYAPAFGYRDVIVYDHAGLVLDPGSPCASSRARPPGVTLEGGTCVSLSGFSTDRTATTTPSAISNAATQRASPGS